MTSKSRQEEKQRRDELRYGTSQSIGRPMDNISDEPDSRIFEPLDAEADSPPLRKQGTGKKLFVMIAVYGVFLALFLTLILYLDAPYRERQWSQEQRDAKSAVELTGPTLTETMSGSVEKVASNNDDYPNTGRRNVMSNIIPSRYVTFHGSQRRYYISRWLRFFLPDDTLKNASVVAIEYDVRPKTRSLMFGKQYQYYSVTALTIDGKSYYSPSTTYGVQDWIILCSVFGLLGTISMVVWRRKYATVI